MKLTDQMAKDPDGSELDAFKVFLDNIMALQQQLHNSYHGDRQLRDRLMNAIDIPRIQEALTDRQPRTSLQLTERVANKLSHKPRTSGTSIAYLSQIPDEQNNAWYTLGQRYHGKARRKLKHYGPRPSTQNPHRNFHTSQARQHQYGREPEKYNRDQRQRRGSPWWLKGVRGCFVCHKDGHRAAEKHTKEEMAEAIKQLKQKNTQTMLTQEDDAFITELYEKEAGYEPDPEEYDNDHHEVNWNEDDRPVYSSDSQDELAYIVEMDLSDIEQTLSKNAFNHAFNISNDPTDMAMLTTNNPNEEQKFFEGVRLDTCANRTSVMGEEQYQAYCHTFGIKPALRKVKNRSVNGIGGTQPAIGLALIDIPFKKLHLMINVLFLILPSKTPALLSTRDMYVNGLDFSLQNKTITFEGRVQELIMDNYFLIHRWSPKDITTALYTEDELRTIHRTFGHPSITTTEKLLKRAQEKSLDNETRSNIRRLAEDCSTCKKYAPKPRRFRLTVGTKDMRFNHAVQIDTMFLNGRPVCHLVDEATH